jgi:Pentapeptide repeats (8 copies)
MANPEHLAKIKEGVEVWNQWREENPWVERPDLTETDLWGANLSGANLAWAYLREADLRRANLRRAQLSRADLYQADLRGADLRGANLRKSDLSEADLRKTDFREADFSDAYLREANLYRSDLTRANLYKADLTRTNLTEANLSEADLSRATLIETVFERANLTFCRVYGVSVWDIRLEGAIQSNLVVTHVDQSPIQVDNLEVAQFIYLLLNNQRIRHVIDTITSKVVLILGRFTPERKEVLDAIRNELRKRDYLPVLFDFQKPASKDLTGTVTTLANMAKFVIADLTDPSSVPHELATIAPGTMVPIQTILLSGQKEYSMFLDLNRRYHWVLKPHQYDSEETLLASLSDGVIAPAEAKVIELRQK